MRTCTVCLKDFTPTRMGQKVCGYRCAKKIGPLTRKSERAATMVAREQQKRLPDLRKEAQKAFNEFIHARDADKPCICCGQWPQSDHLKGGAWDAGHYRSRGAAIDLAFHEDNVHRQLKRCNRRAWDVAGYRAELVRRIGLEAVIALEGPHPLPHYTRDDLRRIRDEYKAKVRARRIDNQEG